MERFFGNMGKPSVALDKLMDNGVVIDLDIHNDGGVVKLCHQDWRNLLLR